MKTTNTEFIVQTAAASMPSSCWGRYGRVAVLEVVKGTKPRMISARARGVVRIVSLRDKLHCGGSRSAFEVALRRARAEADELNRQASLEGQVEGMARLAGVQS
jgi:hypothetical protein